MPFTLKCCAPTRAEPSILLKLIVITSLNSKGNTNAADKEPWRRQYRQDAALSSLKQAHANVANHSNYSVCLCTGRVAVEFNNFYQLIH